MTCWRSGFGNDTALAHAARQKYLSDTVIDFVGTGVVQVFTLEIDFAAVLFGQAVCRIEWGRTPYIVTKQLVVFMLEVFTLQYLEIGVLQFIYTFVKYLGDVCSAEFSVITIFVN